MKTKTINRRNTASCSAKTLYATMVLTLLPGVSLAQEDETIRDLTRKPNEIEIGIANVSGDSFKFGEYSGFKDEGAYLIGNINLTSRGAPLSGVTTYWTLSGTNLGLRSRNLKYEYGDQGNYRFSLEYDQLAKFRTESAQTVFNGVGSANLTLPAGWVGAGTTAGMTQLTGNLKRYDVEQERKNYFFGFSKVLSQEWEIKANFRHETKEGNKVVGAVIGNSGGNPRSVLIPEPVDYETNLFDATFAYTTPKAQFQLGYNASLFSNQNNSLVWQNPYTAIAGWAPAAGFPTGQGQLGLPPDNQFHQIIASGGYNFTETTRLTANFQYGRMTQDQAFLPYTVNPALLVTTPLPRGSLDGRIDNTLLSLALTTRPLPKLNLRASYRYDDRDNKTPQAQYLYIGGDSTNQAVTLASDRARTNLPISYKQNQLKLDADYAIMARTKLNAGYDYEEIERSFAEVDKTREHTYRIGLRRGFAETISGGLSYAHSERKNTGYRDVPFLNSYSPQYIATLAPGTQFDNHPLLRKFTYADRDRDKVRLAVNASPHELVSLQFSADYNQDDYKNSILGLTGTKSQSYTLDASIAPRENLTIYAFYTYDNFASDQKGRTFTAATKLAQATPVVSASDWYNTSDDRADTIGLGFKMAKVGGRLDLGGDYVYSQATGKINTIFPGALPMPDLVSRLNRLHLYGDYQLQKNSSVKLSLIHESLRIADWAYDNVNPNTLANVMTTGQLSPNYTINLIGISMSYRYW